MNTVLLQASASFFGYLYLTFKFLYSFYLNSFIIEIFDLNLVYSRLFRVFGNQGFRRERIPTELKSQRIKISAKTFAVAFPV